MSLSPHKNTLAHKVATTTTKLQTDRLPSKKAGKQTDRHAGSQADRQEGRQAGRQTHRQIDTDKPNSRTKPGKYIKHYCYIIGTRGKQQYIGF